MQSRQRQLLSAIIGAAFVLGSLAASAETLGGKDPTWVPNRAWRAVKKYARGHYDPRAKLFKTDVTKSQSLGLAGAHSKAWIVGASCPQQPQPHLGIMPYKPNQTFYLVAKGENKRWQVTPLAGMGGYLSKVDAATDNLRVGVGVGLHTPAMVGHGVEVSNTRHLSVTKGQALAQKQNGPTTHTVYVKGATPDSPYAMSTQAELRASVPPPPGSWCGTPLPKTIPVHFSQVMFAQPMAQAQ